MIIAGYNITEYDAVYKNRISIILFAIFHPWYGFYHMVTVILATKKPLFEPSENDYEISSI